MGKPADDMAGYGNAGEKPAEEAQGATEATGQEAPKEGDACCQNGECGVPDTAKKPEGK